MKQHTNYHRILRISAIVFAVVLVFESGLFNDNTAQITRGTQTYLTNAIGMSAAVQSTELNKDTEALTPKEKELQAREAALNEREISVNLSNGSASGNSTTYILASVLFILLILILLNYTLDYLRSRENKDFQPG